MDAYCDYFKKILEKGLVSLERESRGFVVLLTVHPLDASRSERTQESACGLGIGTAL